MILFLDIRMLLGVLAILASAGVANASISRTMAQCSALYDVVWVFSQVEETRRRARIAAHVWIQHAAHHAQHKEGTALKVDQLRLSRRNDWAARGDSFIQSVEFRDWADYCTLIAMEYDVRYLVAR